MSKPVQVAVRVEPELVERADALAEQLGGRIATRTSLLREAMYEGFVILEEKYRDVRGATVPQKPARKRRS